MGLVLIADDDAHTRNLVKELVESWGHQTRVAEDGLQAVSLLATPPMPDLALLDLMMPRLDGFAVLARLRADPATSTLPVILLTAAGEVDAKLRGIELGADDYVTKPFRIVDLQQRVAAAITRRHQVAPSRAEVAADPLAGVGTFPQLKETLGYEVERARRYGRSLTALMVAVDESPVVFDTLGRVGTNELLGQLAGALRRSFRIADRVFRIDVEALVVLLPETASDGAQIAASRLTCAVREQPLSARGDERLFTVSIGVADFPRFGKEKADELVRAAHRALLLAQRQGPAQVGVACETTA